MVRLLDDEYRKATTKTYAMEVSSKWQKICLVVESGSKYAATTRCGSLNVDVYASRHVQKKVIEGLAMDSSRVPVVH